MLCFDLLAKLLHSCSLKIQRRCSTLYVNNLYDESQFAENLANQVQSGCSTRFINCWPSMVYDRWYLCCCQHMQHNCMVGHRATAQLHEGLQSDLSACSHVAESPCAGAAQTACYLLLSVDHADMQASLTILAYPGRQASNFSLLLRHGNATAQVFMVIVLRMASTAPYSCTQWQCNCTGLHASSAHIELTSILQLQVPHRQAAVDRDNAAGHRHALLTMS